MSNIELLLERCHGAYAQNTLRGYRNGLRRFQTWCGERRLSWLPAEPESVAAFVDEEAETMAMATVKHRLDAIRFAHMMADLPCPTKHSEVRLAIRRARRAKSARQDQALGLTYAMLKKLIAACPNSVSGLRDAALLSVGYDTLCRSSELVLLEVDHLSACGTRLLVPRSKADPFGEGRIAHLSDDAQKHLDLWLSASRTKGGPLFRGLHTGKASDRPLNTCSIRRIVKRAAERAKIDPEQIEALSGHSMRVGAAQDMLVAGIDTLGIMQAGGWKCQSVLARYVENASTELLHRQRWHRLSGSGPEKH